MTDPGHAARMWTDRSFLRDVQYTTDVNLAARQSIHAYQRAAVAYVRSMRETVRLPDAGPLVEAVTSRLRATPGAVF
jgi:hypothetical protein